jgi:hypothetical protein
MQYAKVVWKVFGSGVVFHRVGAVLWRGFSLFFAMLCLFTTLIFLADQPVYVAIAPDMFASLALTTSPAALQPLPPEIMFLLILTPSAMMIAGIFQSDRYQRLTSVEIKIAQRAGDNGMVIDLDSDGYYVYDTDGSIHLFTTLDDLEGYIKDAECDA